MKLISNKYVYWLFFVMVAVFVLFSHLAFLSALRGLWHIYPGNGIIIAACAALLCLCIYRFRKVFARVRNFSYRRMIIVLIVCGISVRAVFLSMVTNCQTSDFLILHELAQSLYKGEGFTYSGPEGYKTDCMIFMNRWEGQFEPLPTMFRPAGVPLLLAGLYTVTGISETAAKILYLLMSVLIGLGIFRLVFPISRTGAFWGALFWEIYPAGIAHSGILSTETPFTLFLICSVLFFQKGLFEGHKPRIEKAIYLILCGLTAGFSCLVRPQSHHVLCFFAVLFLYKINLRQTLRHSLLILAGIAIPLLAWSGYNFQRFGVFNFQTTEVGSSLFCRSLYVSEENERGIDSLKNLYLSSKNEFVINKVGRQVAIRRLFLAITKENFPYILWKNIHKVWRNDIEIPELVFLAPCGEVSFFTGKIPLPVGDKLLGWILNIVETGYILLLLLALLALYKKRLDFRKINPAFVFLIMNFILTFTAFALFQGTNRYHIPLLPLFFILSGLLVAPEKENETQ